MYMFLTAIVVGVTATTLGYLAYRARTTVNFRWFGLSFSFGREKDPQPQHPALPSGPSSSGNDAIGSGT